MIRTRVGYAGGPQPDPTYHDIGDHAEAVQIDFDPTKMSFGDILDLFWAARRPTRPAWKRQYMSAIFYADDAQRDQAVRSLRRVREEAGQEIYVEILPADTFHRAEDYHQKYYLQRHGELTAEMRCRFDDFKGFVDSTAVARLNGYLGGARLQKATDEQLEALGLSGTARRILDKSAR